MTDRTPFCPRCGRPTKRFSSVAGAHVELNESVQSLYDAGIFQCGACRVTFTPSATIGAVMDLQAPPR